MVGSGRKNRGKVIDISLDFYLFFFCFIDFLFLQKVNSRVALAVMPKILQDVGYSDPPRRRRPAAADNRASKIAQTTVVKTHSKARGSERFRASVETAMLRRDANNMTVRFALQIYPFFQHRKIHSG